uniref:ATP-dependent DNA helicase n=1 Tax=Aegilops tauschii subsp. strangulata TaxID=200361 RepID=A0A453JVC3_AEGTS
MRRRYMDAMALVRRYGKPDIFLTMTCNPNWDEIRQELYPGQTPQDRPDLVVRVFRAKLEELKNKLLKKDILGKVRAYGRYKLTCPEQYDRLISAELPNKKKYPELYKLVVKHMMHGPCGALNLNPECPCTKGRPSCKNHYPRPFHAATLQGKDSYPLYKRREDGCKAMVRKEWLDNRWVVPYNPHLLRYFNCHINVEACGSIKHEGVEKSMLTEYFEANRLHEDARSILYRDFPEWYTWQKSQNNKYWRKRVRDTGGQIGRIVSAHPAEGERYYLRVLLNHVTGATSYEDLRTVNGEILPTFREAAERRGLIEGDNTLDESLTESTLYEMPSSLRWLFATILVFCEPSDVRGLWEKHLDAMSEDYRRSNPSKVAAEQLVLIDIRNMLQSMGKEIESFPLPDIQEEYDTSIGVTREIFEESTIELNVEDTYLSDSLNSDQRAAYDEIMSAIDRDEGGVFFVDGPGGTGKTFLYRALLAMVRGQKKIAIATATSSVAASIMPGGRTAHSRFKIPLGIDDGGCCSFTK